jgi:hypothetical protein
MSSCGRISDRLKRATLSLALKRLVLRKTTKHASYIISNTHSIWGFSAAFSTASESWLIFSVSHLSCTCRSSATSTLCIPSASVLPADACTQSTPAFTNLSLLTPSPTNVLSHLRIYLRSVSCSLTSKHGSLVDSNTAADATSSARQTVLQDKLEDGATNAFK